MAFWGDDGALRRLASRLEQMAQPSTLERLNRELAEAAVTEVRMGFREQRDPYGEPWKPKKRPNGKAILVGRGILRNSITYGRVTARGFMLGSNVAYAPTHQYGSRKVPQRMMLPRGSRDLGRRWSKTFRTVMRAHVRRMLVGSR